MDVVLPWALEAALLAVGLITAAALLFFAARIAVEASASAGFAVGLAAIAAGIIARVVVDQMLDAAGFVLVDALSRQAGVVAAVLVARSAEAGVLLGAGVAAGIAGNRGSERAWLLVAAVAAGASGLVGLPGISAAAYAASPAQLPDWLVALDTLGRHAAWASCLLGAVIGGAISRRGGR